jgi:hypothetical protein
VAQNHEALLIGERLEEFGSLEDVRLHLARGARRIRDSRARFSRSSHITTSDRLSWWSV